MIRKVLFFILFIFHILTFGQVTLLKGKIVDKTQHPIRNATIKINNKQHKIDEKGAFKISVPTHQSLKIKISADFYSPFLTTLYLKDNTPYLLNIVLEKEEENKIGKVILKGEKKAKGIGERELNRANIDKISSINGGVEELLKTQPGVNSNNELSSQYMVRGGNYDENLVYVNGIQWYRPQLVRSGIQEGLSFLNPSLVKSVSFSAGGFQAKYGDKTSSVLNIIYKKPRKFEGIFNTSLLNSGLTLGKGTADGKLSAIIGARYSNKRLLIDTQDSDVDFNPVYFDIQTHVNYKVSRWFNLNFLGSFSKNNLDLFPKSRETTFGTFDNLYRLKVNYTGQEKDLFQTFSQALIATVKPNERLTLTADLSTHYSKEQEYFDINSRYTLGNISPDTGAFTAAFDTAGQIDHARNDLNLLITAFQHKGKFKFSSGTIEWGVKTQREEIRNRLEEYHRVDSAGFIKPVTASAGFHYLYKVNNISALYKLNNHRTSGYAQYTNKQQLLHGKLFYNVGLRATYWDFNKELNVSPRGQVSYRPDGEREVRFRFSTGLYYQPPFYKEIWDVFGRLNRDTKAQQSIHFILGNDYGFKIKEQSFALTSEAYYKINHHINPYYIDNIRTVYIGQNIATGKQYGIDLRLGAELTPDNESFISLSYARSKWNINHRGSIPTPTDQRLKFNLFFQDYMPAFPSFKVHLNAVYASGLPNGAPLYTDRYDFSRRLLYYRRLDIGFTKIFIDQNQRKPRQGTFWSHFKKLSLGLDILNLFDIENHISNLWVQDLTNSQYVAVPNRLSGRLFNVKLQIKF